MKIGTFLGAIAMLVSIVAAPTLAAPQRIVIPHGHGTVFVRGFLRGYRQTDHYTLHARSGQTLSLLITRGGPTVVMLYFPHGGQDGAPGGVQDTLTQTGRYRIAISEHTMGNPWRGRFTLKVSLH